MKQRIVTGFLFALVVAVFIVAGFWIRWLPMILFAAVAVIAAVELTNALRHKGLRPSMELAVTGSLCMLLPILFTAPFARNLSDFVTGIFSGKLAGGFAAMAFILFLLADFSVVAMIIRRGPDAVPDAIATSAIMVYVAFPLSCPAILLYHLPGGWLWLLVGLAAPWISDVFAYFTGCAIGRHPIIPRISPKKTLEGCLGGIVGSILVMPVIFRLFGHTLGGTNQLNWPNLLFYGLSGLLLSIASQLGDWLASGLKRWCGIKDFGRLLPGHGGLMDRFDSAFFTLPMTLILAAFYQRIIL
jgi:phosphatidate cytidylyltransferase